MEEKKNNRTKWIHLRLTTDEYQKLHAKFKKTTCRKLSNYLRNILLEKPIQTTYRNQSLDEMMAQIMLLYKELNAIGNNFNQVVKKLHTLHQIPEFKNWIMSYELDKKILFNKIEETKKYIQKITEKWLQ
ncbi:plasmid mobilization protein [Flavobacterium turcicum]|uniref:Plasmid mobilization relaxosome protein MobC n=1 Tax=Flavobacterium turcicum TaxID=2764718 RepID=A0ABR7JE98_9FLAO|nr:plasmid mobilization relaxosome protein MobC [Flavobacterium turcicum]MBC5862831.1 plasmid mobilization relaxosome protein MobC [Flavobacterium turcicum]NHL01563.1 plasmid mobilization relaxosome protein MobC [Flavobacterium turcicum]